MRRHTQAQVSQPAPLLADFGDMRCNQTDRGGREDGWVKRDSVAQNMSTSRRRHGSARLAYRFARLAKKSASVSAAAGASSIRKATTSQSSGRYRSNSASSRGLGWRCWKAALSA